MSEIKLEAGQWYRTRGGRIAYALAIAEKYDAFLVESISTPYYCKGNGTHFFNNQLWDLIEHLPDCTGFDWEPPKPIVAPEGWEIVEEGFCKKGDRYLFDNGQTGTINIRVGEAVQDAKDARGAVAIIRKIEPKYRPFANAEEFKPHRDRWIRRREGDGACRTSSYCDQGHFTDGVFDTWEEMFERSVFEDGTPFGVRVDD